MKIMWSFQNCPVVFLFSPPVPFLLCLPFTVLSFLGTGPHTVLSLQLSPEEGYVSAKEESFLYPPHSSEDEGLTDAALFRADLALVSGDASQAFFTSLCLDLPSRICWRDFVILKVKTVMVNSNGSHGLKSHKYVYMHIYIRIYGIYYECMLVCGENSIKTALINMYNLSLYHN